MIILPRQARDKQTETTQKEMHEFLAGPLDDPLQLPSLSNFESFFLLKAFGTYAT
jgi:hypothetical protein